MGGVGNLHSVVYDAVVASRAFVRVAGRFSGLKQRISGLKQRTFAGATGYERY